MKRYVIGGLPFIAAAIITLFVIQQTKPPKALGFETSLTPGAGEILLMINHERGELKTHVKSGESDDITHEMPEGFFYADYIPGSLAGLVHTYTKEFYLNASNIDKISAPLRAEINQGGAYMILKSKNGYLNQVKSHKTVTQTPLMTVECTNTIGKAGSFTGCGFGEISHPLFDRACIIRSKPLGCERSCIEFRGYKTIDEPVAYYSFEDCGEPLTDENLASFIKHGDMIEYCILITTGLSIETGEAELRRMAESIKVK